MGPTINQKKAVSEEKIALRKRIRTRLGRHANKVTDTLTIVGLIVVLIILITGGTFGVKYGVIAVRGVGAAAVTLSSKFFPKEEVVPSASERVVVTGKPFIISWDHKNKELNGSYSLYYPCSDGLFLSAQAVSGSQSILCNKNFDFVNVNDQLTITPSSSKFHQVDVPISIRFTKNGASEPSITGVINISVINDAIKENQTENSVSKPAEVSTKSPAQTLKVTAKIVPGEKVEKTYNVGSTTAPFVSSNPNGKPDLHPIILEMGYLDANNNFVASNSPSRGFRIASRFKIENLGDKTSVPFRFNAYLPTYPPQTFNSDEQPGINPGERIEYTIAFDRAVMGTQTFRLLVDPSEQVSNEANRGNNEATTTINIL